MTTGLIPGGQPPDPRPSGMRPPHQRRDQDGLASPHVDNRPRSSVITARAAATFEPAGRSVATARSFVRDTLQGWGFADIVDDAVVLTSELVTNAVVHAGTHADLLCLRSEDGVRIEVADRYPEREIPLQGPLSSMGSPDREGGRGLQLCAAIAGRWGVEYTPTHKQVWFQLD
ncbi:ATP-binding protein, partial [Streptomyces sp. NPDC002920]